MSYYEIGYVGDDHRVYRDSKTNKLVVHFMAVKGYECTKHCPDGYNEMMWNIERTGREFSKAFNIAKDHHKSVRKVNNKKFGGGLSFNLTLEELQALPIWS